MSTAISQTAYNYKVVRQFAVMTVIWGVIGMGLGVFIAAQLVWPELNLNLPWTSFGRLRPLHTNAVIFAFGGCALFATSYYVVQRTCQTRLISDSLAAFTFWGWQAVIVLAVITLPLGYTSTKEYAELEWPIDILLAVVWISYLLVFFGTIVKRKTKHIYVGNWFFGAFILVTGHAAHRQQHGNAGHPVQVLLACTAGATDAMVQWWYGHNAVGFFLTTGFLGMMYYFVPKQAERPVYSVPPVHRALLGADHPVHLGRSAPPALHRPAGLGPVPRHGDVRDPPGAELGWHDQRHDDPVRRLA